MIFSLFLEDSKKSYVGNCVHCLDDDWFVNNIASDATELSNHVDDEDVVDLGRDQFIEICNVGNEVNLDRDLLFQFNSRTGLYWIYDNFSDIHYFYY